MQKKSGISLTVLVITVIIMAILAGAVAFTTSNIISSSKESKFREQLTSIEEKIKEYYTNTGALPIKNNITYTLEDILQMQSNVEKKSGLIQEIGYNGDALNNFYEVDFALIGIEGSEIGQNDFEDDKIFFASNTLRAYYLAGIKIVDDMYFSLTYFGGKSVIEDIEPNYVPETDLNKSINLTKNTYVWSNSITINVTTTLDSEETIRYYVAGINSNTRTLANGVNQIQVDETTMTATEKTAFASIENKYVTVEKYNGINVIEAETISIENLDFELPALENLTIVDYSNPAYNVVQIAASDVGNSGIKYIAYDYVSKLNSAGVLTPYYEEKTGSDKDNLSSAGKKSTNGEFKVDKNVKTIMAMAEDKAGNTSNVIIYTLDSAYIIGQ